jgi:hypothetical protein
MTGFDPFLQGIYGDRRFWIADTPAIALELSHA